MSDLIDRQAVIDAMSDMYKAAERWGQEAKDCDIKARAIAELRMATLIEMKPRIEKLPSAQPDAVEVVRCKDCKWYGDIGCAIRIFDDTYKPSEHDHCSFAERREE